MTEAEKIIQEYKEKVPAFWKDVYNLGKQRNYDLGTSKFLTMVALGDTPWDAYSFAWPESISMKVTQRKQLGDKILADIDTKGFISEIIQLSKDVYNLSNYCWDWTFKDSELTLRYLIAVSEESINKSGLVTQGAQSAILGAVRELNKMYEFGNLSTSLAIVKQVVFAGEDLLED